MDEIIEKLRLPISRSLSDPRPVVVMMCGIAGAGKSTLSKALVAALPNFTRLTLDGIVAEKHGLYGVDYGNENGEYDGYLDEAWEECKQRLTSYLLCPDNATTTPTTDKDKDIVFDRAFWNRADRDEAKALIESLGGRWVLVYLKTPDKGELWKRIRDRRADGLTPDCAFEITPQILDMYYSGFEEPSVDEEGALVVDTVAGTVSGAGLHLRPK